MDAILAKKAQKSVEAGSVDDGAAESSLDQPALKKSAPKRPAVKPPVAAEASGSDQPDETATTQSGEPQGTKPKSTRKRVASSESISPNAIMAAPVVDSSKKAPFVATESIHDPVTAVAIEEETQRLGRFVWGHLGRRKPSIFERRWWDDRIMAAAMADESLKVQMFRFVDVLPRLKTHRDVTRHLQEYFHEVKEHLPFAIEMVRFGVEHLSPESVLSRALAYNARANAARMARRFIAGSSVGEVLTAVTALRKQGLAFTLDLLGEAVISEPEAEAYQRSYLDLIDGLAPVVNAWPESLLAESLIDTFTRGTGPS